jgi:hypothetical protein
VRIPPASCTEGNAQCESYQSGTVFMCHCLYYIYSLQDIVTDFRRGIGADLIRGHLSLEQHNETEKEQVHKSTNFAVVLDDEFGECCDVEQPIYRLPRICIQVGYNSPKTKINTKIGNFLFLGVEVPTHFLTRVTRLCIRIGYSVCITWIHTVSNLDTYCMGFRV